MTQCRTIDPQTDTRCPERAVYWICADGRPISCHCADHALETIRELRKKTADDHRGFFWRIRRFLGHVDTDWTLQPYGDPAHMRP